MTKPICLNLSDGTVVIGLERDCFSPSVTQLENVLLITSTSYVNKTGIYNPQIYLTKYNLFGEDKIMSFNNQSVISKYLASDALAVYYNSFMKTLEDDPDNLSNIDNMDLTKSDRRSFLSEIEEVTKDNKIDIENLRNTVYRNNNNNIPEFDDGVYYEDDEDEDDKDK